MRIVDPAARAACRAIGFCEVCGKSEGPFHAAHLLARGMGAGKQMDVPINLICLCPGCHGEAHAGKICFDRLAGIVVMREVWRMLRGERE